MPEIAVQLIGLPFLAFPPFRQLCLSCASFLLPFSNVLSRLSDALFDMFDLGCHVPVDLFEKVDKLDELFGCGSR